MPAQDTPYEYAYTRVELGGLFTVLFVLIRVPLDAAP